MKKAKEVEVQALGMSEDNASRAVDAEDTAGGRKGRSCRMTEATLMTQVLLR